MGLLLNELSFDMKNGVQAGKVKPALIGEIDLDSNSPEVNKTILSGIAEYLKSITGSPLPPVVLRAADVKQIGS